MKILHKCLFPLAMALAVSVAPVSAQNYKALSDRYEISHEVEYMNYQEPEWYENLTEQEAEAKIVELQNHSVARDSELLHQEIKR